MTTEVDELATLLEAVMGQLTITRGDDHQADSIDAYTRNLKSYWTAWVDRNTAWYTQTFQPHVTDSTLSEKITSLVRTELSEYLYEDLAQTGAFIHFGGPVNGFSVDQVVTNLLKITLVYGPASAARIFYRDVRSESILFQRVALLSGVTVDRDIYVSQGIKIVALPSSTADLPPLVTDVVDLVPGIELLNRAVVVEDHAVSPVLINPNEFRAADPGDKSTTDLVSSEFADFDLRKFCESLSLVCGGSAHPAAHWQYLRRDHVLNFFRGGSISYDRSALFEPSRITLSERHVRDAVSLLQDREALPEDVASILEVPIGRWVKSTGSHDPVEAFIDLGIALESLYLADTGDNTELGFRLGIRAAWHLGRTPAERSKIMDDMRAIYGLRSKAVHTGVVPTDARTQELRKRAEQLCLDSITSAIRSGQFPDWSQTVLGG